MFRAFSRVCASLWQGLHGFFAARRNQLPRCRHYSEAMTGGIGSGVLVAFALVLWALVLVPAWQRRRRSLQSERNALRLQRTLRMLAEASELPEEVHVEATAREAVAKEKLLRFALRRQRAERKRELAQLRLAAQREQLREREAKRAALWVGRQKRLGVAWLRPVRWVFLVFLLAGFVALVFAGVSFLAAVFWPGVVRVEFAGGVAALAGLCVAIALAGVLLLAPGGRMPAARFSVDVTRVADGRDAGSRVAEQHGTVRYETLQSDTVQSETVQSETVKSETVQSNNALREAAAAVDVAAGKTLTQTAATASVSRVPAAVTTDAAGASDASAARAHALSQREAAQRILRAKALQEARRARDFVPAEVRVTGSRVQSREDFPAAANTAGLVSADGAAATVRQTGGGAAVARRAGVQRKVLSPYARMGVVDDAGPGLQDLDTVLQRRRNAS